MVEISAWHLITLIAVSVLTLICLELCLSFCLYQIVPGGIILKIELAGRSDNTVGRVFVLHKATLVQSSASHAAPPSTAKRNF